MVILLVYTYSIVMLACLLSSPPPCVLLSGFFFVSLVRKRIEMLDGYSITSCICEYPRNLVLTVVVVFDNEELR